jgi:hypothetical protein
MKLAVLITLAWLGGLAAPAIAQDAPQNNKRGNSLYLFPLVERSIGVRHYLSVTNIEESTGNSPSVDAHLVLRKGTDCEEFYNTSRPLTPNDTTTFSISDDVPGGPGGAFRGFGYIYAEGLGTSLTPIKFDNLIVQHLVFEAVNANAYEMEAYGFKAGSTLANGASTNIDGDSVRDLNGSEYEVVPNTHIFPRFIASGTVPGIGETSSNELVLVSLVGGNLWSVTVDLLIFNDEEDVWSAQTTFACHAVRDVLTLSNAFSQDFLLASNPAGTNQEYIRFQSRTAAGFETGLLKLTGGSATSSAAFQTNPAIVAALIHRHQLPGGMEFKTGVLPFGKGSNNKGDLVNLSVLLNN